MAHPPRSVLTPNCAVMTPSGKCMMNLIERQPAASPSIQSRRLQTHNILTTSVMPSREEKNTQENPLHLGPWARAPARGLRGAPPYPLRHPFSLRFDSVPVLHTARPAVTFTKKLRPEPSYVHTALFGFLNIGKAPARGGWGTRTSRGSLRVDFTGPWPSPIGN